MACHGYAGAAREADAPDSDLSVRYMTGLLPVADRRDRSEAGGAALGPE
jgi:hypothetical protein